MCILSQHQPSRSTTLRQSSDANAARCWVPLAPPARQSASTSRFTGSAPYTQALTPNVE